MPSLRELQEDFAEAVLADAPGLIAHIEDGAFPAERHVQVYRNNVFAGLTDALAAIFPVTLKLVGEGFFHYTADGYIRRHSPRSGNLHEFGEVFADYLRQFEPAATLPYLGDVARLEWCWHEAFHAADAPPFPVGELARIAPTDYERLRFRLHPSVRLLHSPWPVLRIWETNQDGAAADSAVDLGEGEARLLVHRRDLEVLIEPLQAGDYALLGAFRDGLTLGEAADRALAAEAKYDLPTGLRHHQSTTTLSGFSL